MLQRIRCNLASLGGSTVAAIAKGDRSAILNLLGEVFPSWLSIDDAALHAVARFRFNLRKIGGDPVLVENVQLKFAFTLESLYDLEDSQTP